MLRAHFTPHYTLYNCVCDTCIIVYVTLYNCVCECSSELFVVVFVLYYGSNEGMLVPTACRRFHATFFNIASDALKHGVFTFD